MHIKPNINLVYVHNRKICRLCSALWTILPNQFYSPLTICLVICSMSHNICSCHVSKLANNTLGTAFSNLLIEDDEFLEKLYK